MAPAAFFPAYDKSKLPTTPPAMAPTTVPMPGATEPAACGENIGKIIDQTHHNTYICVLSLLRPSYQILKCKNLTAPYITPKPIPTDPPDPAIAPAHVLVMSLFALVLVKPFKPLDFLNSFSLSLICFDS